MCFVADFPILAVSDMVYTFFVKDGLLGPVAGDILELALQILIVLVQDMDRDGLFEVADGGGHSHVAALQALDGHAAVVTGASMRTFSKESSSTLGALLS